MDFSSFRSIIEVAEKGAITKQHKLSNIYERN